MENTSTRVAYWVHSPFPGPKSPVSGPMLHVIDYAVAFRYFPDSLKRAFILPILIGVPLDTTVSLLRDGEGRIALTLPVSGSVGKPEVDFSSAVNKAIGGVLLQVFPPAMVIAMVEGVAEGGGPTF